MTRPRLSLTVLLCLLATSWPDQQARSREKGATLLVQGGWLFDGISDTRRLNKGLVIRNGIIAALETGPEQGDLANAQVITLAATETILPGLIDLHAHYNLDLVDKGRVEEVEHNGTVFLANGVTATWSAGEFYPERVIARRDLIESGKAIGPRLFVSGPYFGAFRCEYNVKVAEDECIAWPNDITEAEIRADVDKWAAQGVVSIKIKQANPEETRILIDQAHKNGMTTSGHLANYNVEYDVDAGDAIRMGLDRLEHQLTLGSGGPLSAEMPDMVDLVLEHQVYYDANLQMYGGINERNKHLAEMVWVDESQFFTPYTRELLARRGPPPPESDALEFAQRVLELNTLFEAGGGHLLIVGTDEPVYTSLLPGFAYHRELLAMARAGIPPIAVLKAATINGARALGVEDQLGSVEVSKRADLLVVRGNPLKDIKAARDIRIVVQDGVVHDPETLLRSAIDGIGPHGPDDHGDWELTVQPFRTE